MRLFSFFALVFAVIFVGCSGAASVPTAADIESVYQKAAAAKQAQAKKFAARGQKFAAAQALAQKDIFLSAARFARTPYRLGGQSAKKGADCSAFAQSALKSARFSRVPRNSTAQLKAGQKIALEPRKTLAQRLRAGDLLFFRGKGPNARHVGVYIEAGEFVHLSASGGAKTAHINQPYWRARLIAAVRYK